MPYNIGRAHLRLGEYYIKQGDVSRAIESYVKAIELGNHEALTKLGLAYQSVGKFKESLVPLQTKTKNIPLATRTYLPMPILLLARAHAHTKNPAEEIEIYETKLYECRQWWARQSVAEAYLANDEPEKAADVLCARESGIFVPAGEERNEFDGGDSRHQIGKRLKESPYK